MPYWVKRDKSTWAWKYLPGVAVKDKIYICSKKRIKTRNRGEFREQIAICLLDRSMGRPEPLEQNSTRIHSNLKVSGCTAVSQEDEIHLLLNFYDLGQEEFVFVLFTYHTVARSWSEVTMGGPTSPSRHVFGRSCLIGNTIFVYQCDKRQLPPVRAVYALNVGTKEWNLRHAFLWQSDECIFSNVLPWRHYLIGVGHLYRKRRGQGGILRDNQGTVSMFDTTAHTWIVPLTSGEHPHGRNAQCLAVYCDKLMVIGKQDGSSAWTSSTIYCFDLNTYAWSKVNFPDIPAAVRQHWPLCFCIDNLVYCFRLVCRRPYRTKMDVINMKTKSLTKQCLEQTHDAAFYVASKKADENLQTNR